MRPYIALIHKDADSDFGVSFPDLPGCVTAGATLDEARKLAAEALAFHLEGMAADGDTPPAPSSLDDVMADRENRDGVVVLVDPPAPSDKTVRVNITLPSDVLTEIDRYAEANNMTRSAFLQRAAKREMAD